MVTRFALAVCAVTIFGSTAFADYYIVQERSSRECKVVETRPSETTWVQVGPLAFKSRDEADRQVAVVCRRQ
jgi:hypothetical protein